MGTVYVDITLKNITDVALVERGYIKEQDVHQTTVRAKVDTGAMKLIINEEICQKLGLRITQERAVTLADNRRKICKVTESVEIRWQNRETECPALVLPGTKRVLLGAIPLEGLDVMVDPVSPRLVGIHGDEPVDEIG
jgi:clan AA aspartic protease